MIRRITLLLAVSLLAFPLFSQTPSLKFSTVIGGENVDIPHEIHQLDDGNFIAFGLCCGFGAYTAQVAKISPTGEVIWQKNIGGSEEDEFFAGTPTSDGGFLAAGRTYSDDGDLTGVGPVDGISDGWLVKLDADGNILWQKLYGAEGQERFEAIHPTPDGGYILAGRSTSTVYIYGGGLAWAVKVDADGNEIWSKLFGSTNAQYLPSNEFEDVVPAPGGGYYFAGQTSAYPQSGGEPSQNLGKIDGWIVKLDEQGNLVWEQVYGGTSLDHFYAVDLAPNGDLYLAGDSFSDDIDLPGNNGNRDLWAARISPTGNVIWSKNYGGEYIEAGYGLRTTSDGGMVISGVNASPQSPSGNANVWVVKLDGNGNMSWENEYGGSSSEYGYDIVQTSDDDFAVAAYSFSEDGDVPENNGERDWWVFGVQNPDIPVTVDLELNLASPNVDPVIYSTTSLTATLTNTGIDAANGVVVHFPKPDGTVYQGGNEWTASQGSFIPFGPETWTVGMLQPGESATLTVSYFMLTGDERTAFAQVSAVNETDVDSAPNNGTSPTPNEDDEAALTLNGTGGPNCEITATITDITCDDNGTPDNPDDDTFGFTITATNPAPGSGYQIEIPELGTTFASTYGFAKDFWSINISVGDLTLNLWDNDDLSCTQNLTVPAPSPCSNGGDLPDFELLSFFAVYNGAVVEPGDEIVAGTDINVPDHFSNLEFPVILPTFDLNISAYLSTDETVDGGDFLLAETTRLMNASSQNFGFTEGSIGIGTIPAATPPGDYFILLKLDGDDQILETDETNNTLSVAIAVTSGGPGDLIDLELDLVQPNANPAQWSSYPVTATLTNNGDAPATGVKVSFAKPTGVVYTGGNEYDASQGTFNPNGDEIWTVGTIMPGSSATMTVNYFLLASSSPVAYAQVSAANETDADSTPGNGTSPTPNEDDEANTDGGGSLNVELEALEITSNFGYSGGTLYFQWSLLSKNNGTDIPPSQEDVRAGFYLSNDATLSPDDILISEFQCINVGSNNYYTSGDLFAINPPYPDGTYYVIGKVDPQNIYNETNESNNTIATLVTITGGPTPEPDLAISNFEIPAPTVEAGQILNYTFDLANEGFVNVPGDFFIRSYISINNSISGDDIQDGIIITGNFDAGFSVEGVPGASTIPSDLPSGQYFLIVKMDADEQVDESDEYGNNYVSAPFIVTNSSMPPGACETEIGYGSFVCAEHNSAGELTVIHEDFGDRFTTVVDGDAQVLSNQNLGSIPSIVNEYISLNRLVRTVGGIEVFTKDIPTTLLDEYEQFTAWLEYNGGYVLFAFENANPTGNLHAIYTDIDLNVLSTTFLPGFNSIIYGASVRTPQLIAPDRIAFIYQPGFASNEQMFLVVIDDNFEIKSSTPLGNGFSVYGQLREGTCEEWELQVNIGLYFCTHGSCYVARRDFGYFEDDLFVSTSGSTASELSTYGNGNRSRSWRSSLSDGTAYSAGLSQEIPFPTTGANNDVLITKTFNGTFVWEKTITVPDAIKIVAIQEVDGELYFIQEDLGVLSMLNVDCLEDTSPTDGVDLELSMNTNNSSPAIYSNVEVDLTLTNTGTEPATGVVVEFKRPNGTVYTGGNEYDASQGIFNPFGPETWEVGNLAAGETATLTVSYFLLSGDALTPYAQVLTQNEPDDDSTPGNGTCCTPAEDDEATLTLNAFAGGGGIALELPTVIGRDVQLRSINPNPVYHGEIKVTLLSRVEGIYDLETYDAFGRLASTQKVDLQEGRNEITMNVSDYRSGTYYLNMRGQNWRHMPIRFVVARW